MKHIGLIGLIGLISLAGLAGQAHAFIGPSTGQTPGSGGGLFQVDASRNIGFGTASPTPVSTFNTTSTESGPSSFGYVFTVASTSNPGIAVKKTSATGFGYVQYVWSVRDFGNLQLYRESANLPGYVVFDINPYGDVGIGAHPTSTGSGVPARLTVGGAISATNYASQLPAGNVASGVFGSLQGNGNFAFPAALGVGTSTTDGFPASGLYVAGSVGIGTANPSSKLHVVNAGSASILQLGSDATGKTHGFISASADTNGYLNIQSIKSEGSTWGDIVLNASGGNVGIGTTTPAYKLHSAGTIAAGDAAITNQMSFSASGDGGIFGTVTNHKVTIRTNNANRMTIDTSGNVGIGTSTPESIGGGYGTLDIRGSAGGGIVVGKSSAERAFYYADASYVYLGSWSNLPLRIQTNNTDRIRVDTAGNVGIATTTPVYKLDVVGTGRFTGQLTVPTPSADTSAATKAYVDSVVGGGSGSGSFTTLTVSGTSTLATNANDRVGIGTAAPADKLHITGGNLRIDTSYSINSSGADIAFHKGRADDTTYEWVGFYSGATRQGIILYDGAWTSCSNTTDELCIRAEGSNKLSLYSASDIRIMPTGNVGIASSSPGYGLTVVGTGYFSQPVIVGTPTAAGHAATKSYVDSSITAGSASTTAACTGDATCEMNGANLQGGDITGVDKLTVTTIDPLYQIGTKKYATYVASIAGGVKEEYVGSAKLVADHSYLTNETDSSYQTYSYTVDFDKLNDGSALWVWRKTVEFGKDTVQVLMTPYGASANLYYLIQGNKLVFRGDKSVEFSYRLIGNRFDWRQWPTLAKDQNERSSLIIK
jgi:hypothetical protein